MLMQDALAPLGSPARRIATRAIFFITGTAMGLWAALVPYAQIRTNAEAGDLGLLLLCLGGGSLAAMLGCGRLIGKVGCRAVIIASVILYCLMLPLLATLTDIRLLAAALLLFGVGIGLADVAVNVQGTLVEQAADKPLMSGFHCLWSVGGIAGAGGGALLLGYGMQPLQVTLCAIVPVVLISLGVYPSMLTEGKEEPREEKEQGAARYNFRLIVMAVMAMICFMAEGAILDWGGIFITRDRGLSVEHAGWGFATFAIAMSLMRLTGDAVVSALGRKKVLMIGGLLGMAGYLMVILLPGWQFTLCGFAIVGIGAANVVPVLITLAGQETVMPVNRSVAMVATLGYFGVLGGPALIGGIAHLTSLSVAFALVAALFVAVMLGAGRLKYRR